MIIFWAMFSSMFLFITYKVWSWLKNGAGLAIPNRHWVACKHCPILNGKEDFGAIFWIVE